MRAAHAPPDEEELKWLQHQEEEEENNEIIKYLVLRFESTERKNIE
jgi:hypothetical protein